jgi:hypothetical protein
MPTLDDLGAPPERQPRKNEFSNVIGEAGMSVGLAYAALAFGAPEWGAFTVGLLGFFLLRLHARLPW